MFSARWRPSPSYSQLREQTGGGRRCCYCDGGIYKHLEILKFLLTFNLINPIFLFVTFPLVLSERKEQTLLSESKREVTVKL